MGTAPPHAADELEEPYLTAHVPPVPGVFKQRPEDFRVDEVPLYAASGEGTHTYLRIEKCGLDTPAAVRAIARALCVRASDIGRAGLKDARAVTTQWLSIEHVEPGRVRALELRGIRVLEVTRHANKLRRGHLRANRFAIRLRETDPARAGDVEAVLGELSRRGMPNWFGPQRFGNRGDADRIGAALLRGDDEELVRLLCGRPTARDTGPVREARELFDAECFAEAAARFPRAYHDARCACAVLARKRGDFGAAAKGLDRRARGLFASAWQSRSFNRVLAARLRDPALGIERVLPGDVALRHDTGGVFLVEPADAADAMARAERFELSPSGPLPGPRTLRPAGRPREVEDSVVAELLADAELLARAGRFGCKGGRRALRERPEDCVVEAGTDEDGSFLELRFRLPSGTYATSLLREVCKGELR